MIVYRCLLLCTILLALCGLSVPPVGAQPLYDILSQVVQHHDLIQAAQARKDAAEQNLRLMQSDWYPHLAASANIGQEYIDPPGDRESTSKLRNYQSLRATQLVYNFGRTGSGIARAQRTIDRAAGELVAVRQEVIFQGVSAYLGVLRHAQRLELARQSEKRIVALTGIEETLVTRGAGLASDVLQAKSQLAGASALRVRTEGQLITARNRFQTVFGVELTDAQVQQMAPPSRPVSHLPPSLEAALDAARHNSLELYIAGMELEVARHDISYRQARYYPTLQLVGEAKRRENDIGIDGVRNEALGMLELNWDIFSGGRERAAVRQARFNLADQEKRKADLSLLVRERVLSAWQNLSIARDIAHLLRDQADVLEQFLELARRERQLGARSLLDVLNGEVMYINALSNAISADLDQDMALYGMLFAIGQLELDVFSNH